MIPLYGQWHGGRVAGTYTSLILLAITLLGSPGTTWSAPVVKVMDSDTQHVRLQVQDLETTWREVNLEDKGVLLFDARIAGMVTRGEPGDVRTPRKSGWLLVPPGTTPRVRTEEERWSSAGSRPLLVAPIPVMVESSPDFQHTGEILVLPDEDIPADAPLPRGVRELVNARGKPAGGPALHLGEIRWWRGHRVVPWTLNPLRHDGRLATESLTDGTWEIIFEADKAGTAVPRGHDAKFTTKGDDRFEGLFLNPDLLDGLPTDAAYQGLERPRADKAATGKGTLLGNMEGRIKVPSTRLYKVTASRLASLGFIPADNVQESQIRLYQRRYLSRLDDGSGDRPYAEIEVPIHMVGEGDTFDGDDFFIFYGLRLRDDTDFTADLGEGDEPIFGCGDNDEYWNQANTYWVAASEPDAGEEWARMEPMTLPAASGTPLQKYRREDYFEEQDVYRQNVENVDVDRLYMVSDHAVEGSVAFSPLWSPLVTGDDIQLELGLVNAKITDETLHFELVTDNTLVTDLGDVVIESEATLEQEFNPGAAAFAGATSKVVMTNPGSSILRVWLNWARLSYDARYEAVGNRLTFTGDGAAGGRPIEVTDFTNNDVGLFEITDPRAPRWVALGASNLVADGDGYKLSIMPDETDGQRKFAATASLSTTGVAEFNHYNASLAADQVSPVDLEGADPDLLVVIHPDFREAAQRWIDHRIERSGGDLVVHVAEVQDIYDWYSGGLKDPWAIKRLTTHAINQWGSWAMVIIGDANENVHQLDVAVNARNWSVDWVPTHLHIQDTGSYVPEVLATDKWYVTFEAGMNYPLEDFPDGIYSPFQMYEGRLPCNSVAELNTMIDKIQAVDNVQEGQDWRRRMILMADDAWSAGYGSSYTAFTHSWIEEEFAGVERDYMRPLWEGGTPVTLEPDTLFLDTYLHPVWVADGMPSERSGHDYQDYVETTNALSDLRDAMNAGGLFLHYQGHGSASVLCSESWVEDFDQGFASERNDVDNLVNADRPWVFFGMGCHIADWAQDPNNFGFRQLEPAIGEKFLTHAGGGASAVYASSGYEYISPNRDFGEYMIDRWINNPPAARMAPSSVGSLPHRSRWMLGELMWYCEADVLADYIGSQFRYMVAQYQLLGDPLMMLDAGPAEITATLEGTPEQPISGEVELEALDLGAMRTIDIVAKDEAGIDRIRVTDSNGVDLTGVVVTETLPEGEADHQEVHYQLDLPVRAFPHQITVEVFGSGAPLDSDPHYSLVLDIPHEAVFTVAGEEIPEGEYVFAPEEPVDFQFTLSSGGWLGSDQTIGLTGDNLTISNVVIDHDKANTLTGSFTAMAEAGTMGDRVLVMTIGGIESTFTLEGGGAELPPAAISRVMNYPNPMRDGTRFVFETSASRGEGQVRVFSVAGRTVANIPFTYSSTEDPVIEWNGRDNEGDGLANGTYLYRLEMETPSGMLVSPMQRLVVMN